MVVSPIFTYVPRAALAASLLTLLQASACAATITVPPHLQPAATQTLVLEARAEGVQIYTCNSSTREGGTPVWILKAPEAILYDAAGAKVATHYAGPTWEAVGGSKVVGKVKATGNPSSTAIPWLLLDVKETEGAGVFGKITTVQRLATEAGTAPEDGCNPASLGSEVRVPYKAVYRFYTGK